MDKLKMHTANLSDEKYDALAQMFPNAVTETIDENGTVIRAIDKDVLMQEINTHVVEGREERYQFTWPDKRKSVLLANAPIAAALRPARAESVDFDNTENLYIEGDNLDVLKLLRETYLNRVKMIYIDPPYNTGNDFVYEDDFTEDAEGFLRRDRQYDGDGYRMTRILNSNGRFHTDWLNMIYPRLRVARDLLTQDGIVFISIDDNEVHNLQKLCDEIFGEENFIANIVVESGEAYGVKVAHKDKTLFKVKDYVLVYSKNSNCEITRIPLYDKAKEPYDSHFSYIIDENLNKLNFIDYLKSNKEIAKEFEKFSLAINKENINTMMKINKKFKDYVCYGIADILYKDQQFTLKIPNETIKLLNENEVVLYNKYLLTKTSGGSIRHFRSFKETLCNTDELESEYCRGTIRGDLWKNFVKDMGNVGKEGGVDFRNGKKPVRLIKQLAKWTNTQGNDIILDFFSGSATTAHAIMQLNAEDGGKRRFIMVQLPEVCDEKSEAAKAGYKNICEIGKERIRRAGKKIKTEVENDIAGLEIGEEPKKVPDIGFRVLKLDSSNMKDVFYTPDELAQMDFNFDGFIDNIKPDRSGEDLLFQVMLELGIPLSAKITQESGLWCVNGNYLIACFDTVNTEIITEIAKKKPYYAVFRDSSFGNDSAMINFEQVFNTYSPNTIRRVL